MDILFIDPPYKSLKGIGSEHGYSISLLSLASYLSANGYDSKVLTGNLLIDLPIMQSLTFNVSKYAEGQKLYSQALDDDSHLIWKKLLNYIKEYKPKAVGITFLTPASELVYKIGRVIKNYDASIKIIVGGHHPTFCPDETIGQECIDFVIRGEGEIPLLNLMKELTSPSLNLQNVPCLTYIRNNQIIHNPKAESIYDLDVLPLPDRSLVLDCDFKKHRGHYLSTARGCPYTCLFCSDRALWDHKVRRRTINSVINEIKYLYQNFDFDYIDITDGTFTYDQAYVESFCNALIDLEIDISWRCTARYNNINEELLKLLKKANCKGLYFGLESGSKKILETYRKNITIEDIINTSNLVYNSGIAMVTSIMIGLPQETAEDIESTLSLMKKIKTHIFDINSYVPLPGTVLYDNMKKDKNINMDWKKLGYKSYANFFSNHITQDELQNYLHRAYEIAEETLTKFTTKGSWGSS